MAATDTNSRDTNSRDTSSGPALSGPLASALERGRDGYNARFVRARGDSPGLDPQAFADHLVANLDPLVRALATELEARPELSAGERAGCLDAIVHALYELSLDLVARRYLGPQGREPALNALWHDVLPRLARPMLAASACDSAGSAGRAVRRVTAALTNAVHHLCGYGASMATAWSDELLRVEGLCPDAETLLATGQILAWRCGLAHYRDSALALWRDLPDPLAREVLGAGGAAATMPRAALEAALDDPWFDPREAADAAAVSSAAPGAPALTFVGALGGFRGFGGLFVEPPRVGTASGHFHAWDSRGCWTLHVDCFGATARRALEPPAGAGATSLADHPGWEQLTAAYPWLRGYAFAAACGPAYAVTLPASHRIYLFRAHG